MLFKLRSLSMVPALEAPPARPPWLRLWERPLLWRLGEPTWSCFCRFDFDSLIRVSCRADFDFPNFWVKISRSCRRARLSWTIFSNARDPTERGTIDYWLPITLENISHLFVCSLSPGSSTYRTPWGGLHPGRARRPPASLPLDFASLCTSENLRCSLQKMPVVWRKMIVLSWWWASE